VKTPSGAAPPPRVHAHGAGASGPDNGSGAVALSPARRDRVRNAVMGALTFTHLKWASFTHSAIYLSLLISAFAAGQPEPLTAVLGWTHGVLWIGMSLACLAATRLRVIPQRVAVAVAVLGGVGPFFGSFEFAREQRWSLAAQGGKLPR
jgi:hypothetical protein